MLTVGITGGLGTGKTTVARIFKEFGAVVLDADVIAHRLIQPKSKAWREIKDCFGSGILNEDGTISREALAEKVFSDKKRLKKLGDIIHPLVYKEIEKTLKKIKKANPNAVAVLDVPLLLESGGGSKVEKLVVVKSKRSIQIRRSSKNLGLSRSQILQRMDCQMPLREKIKAADFVIDNSGTLDSTRKQATKIWKALMRNIVSSHRIEDILEVLKNEIGQSKETRLLPAVALLLIDIDNLERFNRWYGRGVGNKILDSMEKILKDLLKPGDLLARYGGDEFLILLRSITREEAKEKARVILETVKAHEFQPNRLRLSVSIGIAYYFSFAFSPDEFLGCAVEALSSAQKEGRVFKVFMEEEEWDEE